MSFQLMSNLPSGDMAMIKDAGESDEERRQRAV